MQITKKNLKEFAKLITQESNLVKKVYIEDGELVIKTKDGFTLIKTKNQQSSIVLNSRDIDLAVKNLFYREEALALKRG